MLLDFMEYTAKPATEVIQDNDYAITNNYPMTISELVRNAGQVYYITVGIPSALSSLGVTPKCFLNAVVKLLEYS